MQLEPFKMCLNIRINFLSRSPPKKNVLYNLNPTNLLILIHIINLKIHFCLFITLERRNGFA